MAADYPSHVVKELMFNGSIQNGAKGMTGEEGAGMGHVSRVLDSHRWRLRGCD